MDPQVIPASRPVLRECGVWRVTWCLPFDRVIQPFSGLARDPGSERNMSGRSVRHQPREAMARAAAFAPHMPCAPAPGGVEAEHR